MRGPEDAPDDRSPWAPWAWAAAIAGAAWVPGAGALLPCLLVLKGPLALAPLLAAALSSLARWGRLRWPAALDRPAPALAVAFVFLGATGLWYVSGLRVSGDEPHYLLMAQSLWNEQDLDLRDNLERQDYLEYTPGPVAPHYGSPRRDGRPFPAHSPGLPLLLAPFYAIGGRRACALLLALCGALLAGQVRLVAERLGADAASARLAWAASLGPPVFFYGFHVYTELPAALAIAVAVRFLTPRARLSSALGAALAIACLPWLHLKLLLVAAALAALGAAPPARPTSPRVRRGARGRGCGVPVLVPLRLRTAQPVRDLRRHAARVQRGQPLARAGRPAARPLVRPAAVRARLGAGTLRLRPPRADGRRPRAPGRARVPGRSRGLLADVVGRTVPARALPGAGGGRAGDGGGARDDRRRPGAASPGGAGSCSRPASGSHASRSRGRATCCW